MTKNIVKILKKCKSCKNCEPCWESSKPGVIDTCMHCHEERAQMWKDLEEEFGIVKAGN